jgi:carboxylesterase type B
MDVPAATHAVRIWGYHGSEIWYAFGNFEQQAWLWTSTVQRLSDLFARFPVAFAGSGDPNHGDSPNWPAFDSQTDLAMLFTDAAAAAPVVNRDGLHFFDRHFRLSIPTVI